jgi:hypothetical protein
MITRMETPGVSTHIEDTVQAIARLRADDNRRATPLQRRVDHFTAHAGSPRSVFLLTLLVASWIALNSPLMVVGINRSTKRHSFGCRVPSLWRPLHDSVQRRENDEPSRAAHAGAGDPQRAESSENQLALGGVAPRPSRDPQSCRPRGSSNVGARGPAVRARIHQKAPIGRCLIMPHGF